MIDRSDAPGIAAESPARRCLRGAALASLWHYCDYCNKKGPAEAGARVVLEADFGETGLTGVCSPARPSRAARESRIRQIWDDDVSGRDMKRGSETGGRVLLCTPTYSIVIATAWPDPALIIVKAVP